MFGLDNDQLIPLLYLVLLLAFVGSGLGYRRGQFAAALGHLVIWAAVALSLVAVYAYRAPLLRFAQPVLAEFNPSRAVEITRADGAKELVIRRGSDGHFHVEADVNGSPVRFLVDTGATTTVLSMQDAERSGIETELLEFNRPAQTANGLTYFAHAQLRTLEIGPFRLSDVPVGVMQSEAMNLSLLGMSALDRFGSWRIEGNEMVLVP
jgi:aspartyl protease family protein